MPSGVGAVSTSARPESAATGGGRVAGRAFAAVGGAIAGSVVVELAFLAEDFNGGADRFRMPGGGSGKRGLPTDPSTADDNDEVCAAAVNAALDTCWRWKFTRFL